MGVMGARKRALDTHVNVFNNLQGLARGAAVYITSLINQTLSSQDLFSLMLSGGSTPRAVYTLLGSKAFAPQIDWAKVHIFWGDERCVPPDHSDSNYCMARETLLERVPLPGSNVHRICGELAPEVAALHYEGELVAFFGERSGEPRFDLIMLGMGDDGHIASLFPGSPALEEKSRLVSAVKHDQPPPPLIDRVSVTLPLINAARQVMLIITGEAKARRVAEAFSEADKLPSLPVQRVKPIQGEVIWLLDEAATQEL